MKRHVSIALLGAGLLVFTRHAGGETTPDARTLIDRAEKAKTEGDMLTAVARYTEAISALRLKAAPADDLVWYTDKRDKLVARLLFQFSEVDKRRAEIIEIQKDIAKKLHDIVRIDQDVQSRVKKNERRLKDIETELLTTIQ
jgi:Mg2+ and Co2+ transporter CorA